jgi:signal transduction histidine kinase
MFLEIHNMQIRTRLTLQFLLLGGIIMIIVSFAIYFFSASFRQEDFYNRLRNNARSTAKFLLDANVIDAERVRRFEKDNPVKLQNEKVIIINYRNDVIYSSDEKSEIPIRNDILERARMFEKIFYKQGPYEPLGTLYIARLDRFVLIAAATDTDGLSHLRKLRIILTFASLFSLLLFTIAGWFYAGRSLKPISNVINKVEEITITSLNLRVSEGNKKDEIGRLAQTFNKMLERLETSFAMQKDFIANASHELRTPLTSINGQLEVLTMKDRSAEEYKAAIGSVLDDIRALIVLSNKLLLIARTSAEGPVNFDKKTRLDEILCGTDELKKFNNSYQMHISMDDSLTDSDQMIVAGDEYLLRVAVSNIMDNACKYSPDHTVTVQLEHLDKWIKVQFTDKGIGISEEEMEKVFEPFYRGDNALSLSGNGIGLPLVNQIIKIHYGNIELSSQIGKGTTVSILLPTA